MIQRHLRGDISADGNVLDVEPDVSASITSRRHDYPDWPGMYLRVGSLLVLRGGQRRRSMRHLHLGSVAAAFASGRRGPRRVIDVPVRDASPRSIGRSDQTTAVGYHA